MSVWLEPPLSSAQLGVHLDWGDFWVVGPLVNPGRLSGRRLAAANQDLVFESLIICRYGLRDRVVCQLRFPQRKMV